MSRYKLQAWLSQWEQVVRAAKRKYRGSEKELAIIQEMYQRLHVVRRAVADGDFDGAVFSAVQLGLWAGEWGKLIEVPKIQKEARSENARQAANERNELPLPTVEALKMDYRERLQNDPAARPTTIFKDMAEAYTGRRESWRRIRTQVQK